ncbi:MAG: HAD-IC family P-type ATPase, partial [Pseudomonadota bacterium]
MALDRSVVSDRPAPYSTDGGAPHAEEFADVLVQHQVDPEHGLSATEAASRLTSFGHNSIEAARSPSLLRLVTHQFESPVVWLLIIAVCVALGFGEYADAIAISAVLLINAGIGFFTEYKALRSMEALRKIGQAHCSVLRDGRFVDLASEDIVPGDIVQLSAGNVVPADIRVIDTVGVQVSEAPLTGESIPVEKQTEPVAKTTRLGDRSSMLFKGTAIARGQAKGVVTSTGMDTEIGHIAQLMSATEDETSPLEEQLGRLGGQLLTLTLLLCVLIASVGILSGRDTLLMIHAGIALAVAAIPEGLPIVATLALARGLWEMAEKNALIERM